MDRRRYELLIKDELVENLFDSKKRIIKLLANMGEDNYEAFYLYSFSIFESVLLDIVKTILIAFPEKIDKTHDINVIRNGLYENPYERNHLEVIVESYTNSISKGSLNELLKIVEDKCSIWLDLEKDKHVISSMNKLRNLLTHDYYSKSNSSREDSRGIASIENFMKKLISYIEKIINEIENKYNKYTRKKYVEVFWNKIFETPILPFDQCIYFLQRDNDRVQVQLNVEYIRTAVKSISSSEKFFLSLVIQQFSTTLNDTIFKFSDIPMLVSLDDISRQKVNFILDEFRKHPHLLNGMEMKDKY